MTFGAYGMLNLSDQDQLLRKRSNLMAFSLLEIIVGKKLFKILHSVKFLEEEQFMCFPNLIYIKCTECLLKNISDLH